MKDVMLFDVGDGRRFAAKWVLPDILEFAEWNGVTRTGKRNLEAKHVTALAEYLRMDGSARLEIDAYHWFQFHEFPGYLQIEEFTSSPWDDAVFAVLPLLRRRDFADFLDACVSSRSLDSSDLSSDIVLSSVAFDQVSSLIDAPPTPSPALCKALSPDSSVISAVTESALEESKELAHSIPRPTVDEALQSLDAVHDAIWGYAKRQVSAADWELQLGHVRALVEQLRYRDAVERCRELRWDEYLVLERFVRSVAEDFSSGRNLRANVRDLQGQLTSNGRQFALQKKEFEAREAALLRRCEHAESLVNEQKRLSEELENAKAKLLTVERKEREEELEWKAYVEGWEAFIDAPRDARQAKERGIYPYSQDLRIEWDRGRWHASVARRLLRDETLYEHGLMSPFDDVSMQELLLNQIDALEALTGGCASCGHSCSVHVEHGPCRMCRDDVVDEFRQCKEYVLPRMGT